VSAGGEASSPRGRSGRSWSARGSERRRERGERGILAVLACRERGHGADEAGESSRVRRITNAPLSSTFIVYARTTTEGAASKGITAFIVERGFKGFEVGEHLDKFGVSWRPRPHRVSPATPGRGRMQRYSTNPELS
jgi:isovaleryl-CoA dehydrogenase